MKSIYLLLVFIFTALPFSVIAADHAAPLPEVLQPKSAPTYDTRKSLLAKQEAECVGNQSALFTKENTALLCSCIVANTDTLLNSDKNLRRYVLQERGWVALKDKVLIHAYPDCIAAATKRFSHDECVMAFQSKPTFKSGQEICKCVGKGFETFILDRSSSFTTTYLDTAPKGMRPYEGFLSGHGMKVENKYLLTTCIQRHEYGWK